jgi:hypothetical protein
MQRTKARALAGDRRPRVQEVAGRARQAVEARDGEHVALGELREHTGELGTGLIRPLGFETRPLAGFASTINRGQ